MRPLIRPRNPHRSARARACPRHELHRCAYHAIHIRRFFKSSASYPYSHATSVGHHHIFAGHRNLFLGDEARQGNQKLPGAPQKQGNFRSNRRGRTVRVRAPAGRKIRAPVRNGARQVSSSMRPFALEDHKIPHGPPIAARLFFTASATSVGVMGALLSGHAVASNAPLDQYWFDQYLLPPIMYAGAAGSLGAR